MESFFEDRLFVCLIHPCFQPVCRYEAALVKRVVADVAGQCKRGWRQD
jgi:hypothetical protein